LNRELDVLGEQGHPSNYQQKNTMERKSQNLQHNDLSPDIEIRPDTGREKRKGIPEVIFGETKSVTQIIAMAHGLLNESGRAIVSRVRPEAISPLQSAFQEYTICVHESDFPIAAESAVVVKEIGCYVTCIYDVGVAGLHRLLEPLRSLLSNEVDVIIVAAGMDGALPSVVAGIVPVPVIGLPTSIGYGFGGNGIAALLSMLQTCAPGLSVVNIDNGVGAGITAALIANRVAQARGHQSR
jgi:NCAIR mutase (PurE)-related protein